MIFVLALTLHLRALATVWDSCCKITLGLWLPLSSEERYLKHRGTKRWPFHVRLSKTWVFINRLDCTVCSADGCNFMWLWHTCCLCHCLYHCRCCCRRLCRCCHCQCHDDDYDYCSYTVISIINIIITIDKSGVASLLLLKSRRPTWNSDPGMYLNANGIASRTEDDISHCQQCSLQFQVFPSLAVFWTQNSSQLLHER